MKIIFQKYFYINNNSYIVTLNYRRLWIGICLEAQFIVLGFIDFQCETDIYTLATCRSEYNNFIFMTGIYYFSKALWERFQRRHSKYIYIFSSAS